MNLIRWALWSRTRLFLTVAGAFTGMLFLSMVAAALAPHHTAPTPTPVSAPAFTAPSPHDDGAPVPGGQVTDGTPAEQAEATARAFLDVWMHPEDPITWSAKMTPFVTPDVAALAYAVDATQIPTGHPQRVVVQDVNPGNALVRARLSPDMTVFVSLEPTDQGWRVNGLTGKHEE